MIWLTILWIYQIWPRVTIECVILPYLAVWLISPVKMIVVLWMAIPMWRWVRNLNLNLTFWMRHVWVETTTSVLALWWISTWLVRSVACCSGFVDATYRLWTYVLLSVVERSYLFSILLHIDIFTLHSHRTRRSAIFAQVIWFGADASFFHLRRVVIFVNIVNAIDSMSLYQSRTVAASTCSSFAGVDVAVRQFADACLFICFLSCFRLVSPTTSRTVLLTALRQNYICISVFVLNFGPSLLCCFLHVLFVHKMYFLLFLFRIFLPFFYWFIIILFYELFF